MSEELTTDLAWAAGVFDHGGYIKQKNRTLYLRVTFLFEGLKAARFQAVLGIGKLYGPYKRGGGRTLQWVYELTGREKVARVLARLYPYLTKPCRYQGLLDQGGSSIKEASSYLYKEEAGIALATA